MIDVISIGSLVDSQEPSIVQFQYTDGTIGSSRMAPPIESEPDLISDSDFNLVPELEFDLDSQPDDLSDLITESDDDLVSVPKFFVVSEPDFDLRSEHEFGLVSEPENFKVRLPQYLHISLIKRIIIIRIEWFPSFHGSRKHQSQECSQRRRVCKWLLFV